MKIHKGAFAGAAGQPDRPRPAPDLKTALRVGRSWWVENSCDDCHKRCEEAILDNGTNPVERGKKCRYCTKKVIVNLTCTPDL